jgi:hypothetical protein
MLQHEAMTCSQDAVPWAFPRNFRAPPLQTSRRQRLLSFLRGASPQRSSPAATAGSSVCAGASSTSRQRLPSSGPVEHPDSAPTLGGAAAGNTQGVIFSQLSVPAGALVGLQDEEHSPKCHRSPAELGPAPDEHRLASPMQQLLSPPHISSSDPQPATAAQHSQSGIITAHGSDTSEGARPQPAAQHLDRTAGQRRVQHLQQQQQKLLPAQGGSPGPCAADIGAEIARPLQKGLSISPEGGCGGNGGSIDSTTVSSRDCPAGVRAADRDTAGSLRAAFGGGSLPPANCSLSAQSSLPSDGASGESRHHSSPLSILQIVLCCRGHWPPTAAL